MHFPVDKTSVSLSNASDPKSVKHEKTKSFKNSNEVNGRVHNSEVVHIFLGCMSLAHFCCKANIIFIFSLEKHRHLEKTLSILVLLLHRLHEQTNLCTSIQMKAVF